MVEPRKRKVNPALLLGGEGESVSQPELVGSGEFAPPRQVRNFLSDVVKESADKEEGKDVPGGNLLPSFSVEDDEPSLGDLEQLGLGKVSRRPGVSPVTDVAPVPPVVAPVVSPTVEEETEPVVDEPSLGDLEQLGLGKVERTRKVNPLFLAGDEPTGVVREVVSEPEPEVVKPVVRKVNPAFMLDKEPVKPAVRPGFLDTGRVPSRKPVETEGAGAVVKEVGEDERVRKLFVTRSDSKPRSPYTKRVDANVDAEDWLEDTVGVSAGLGGEVDEGKRKADHKGFHFKERDALILRFLARYRYAYVDQVARLVDSTPRNVMARLRVLEKRGFIRREAVTGTQYLWTTRKAGNLLVDVGFKEIKKGNISYATISHTIGLANLGVEFEREMGGQDLLGEGKGLAHWEPNLNRWKFGVWGHPGGKGLGEMTVTEREIRQGQTRWRGNRDTGEMRNLVMKAVANVSGPECEEGNEGLFVVYGLQGGEHVPDFVIARERNSEGGVENIAVELELTEKTNAEWRKIIRNYRDNGQMFKKVYYFTHKKAIANALMKIIEQEGMEGRVILRKYAPKNGRLPFWG